MLYTTILAAAFGALAMAAQQTGPYIPSISGVPLAPGPVLYTTIRPSNSSTSSTSSSSSITTRPTPSVPLAPGSGGKSHHHSNGTMTSSSPSSIPAVTTILRSTQPVPVGHGPVIITSTAAGPTAAGSSAAGASVSSAIPSLGVNAAGMVDVPGWLGVGLGALAAAVL